MHPRMVIYFAFSTSTCTVYIILLPYMNTAHCTDRLSASGQGQNIIKKCTHTVLTYVRAFLTAENYAFLQSQEVGISFTIYWSRYYIQVTTNMESL
jgi:hypothetical protein